MSSNNIEVLKLNLLLTKIKNYKYDIYNIVKKNTFPNFTFGEECIYINKNFIEYDARISGTEKRNGNYGVELMIKYDIHFNGRFSSKYIFANKYQLKKKN